MLSEGGRRLRALVRTLWSPAVWLLVGTQILYIALQRVHVGAGEDQGAAVTVAMLSGALLLFVLYLQCGVYRVGAGSRDAVAVSAVLRAGREVFGRFLWLTIKAGLFLGALFALVMVAGHLASGEEKLEPAQFALPARIVLAVMPWVLVWWLPWVFMRERFGMVESLKAAWALFLEERRQLPFLALLTVVPTSLLALLPAATPLVAALVADAVSLVLLWVANFYCLEWLSDRAAGESVRSRSGSSPGIP